MNVSITPSPNPRAQAWNAALLASPGELDTTIAASQIDGAIPAALIGGRLLSNGPGWTRIGDWNAHPFDGHGYVRAFEFMADGSLRLRARFVETRVYRDERDAGRFVHRGLATNIPGLSLRNLGVGFGPARNVANTTVYRWRDRLLAGWEGGEPHSLDPDSLATRGLATFTGALAEQVTLAHMSRDPASDRLITCSVAGREAVSLSFREFEHVDGVDRLRATRRGTVEGMMFAHDFAFTRNWTIVAGNPLRLEPRALLRTLVGRSTMLRAVATREAPGVLHLLPRAGEGEVAVRSVRLPEPAFVIHFANAFEREDGTVVVDACVFERFEFGEELGYTGPRTPFDPSLPDARAPQRLLRYTIAPGASEATQQRLAPYAVDFPGVDPRSAGADAPTLFGAARADTRYGDPFDSIIAVDLRDPDRPAQLWTAPEHVFVGEPRYAAGADEHAPGYLLALLSDGLRDRSLLAIFSAAKLDAGPIATVPLPLLPVAFHGDWEPRWRE